MDQAWVKDNLTEALHNSKALQNLGWKGKPGGFEYHECQCHATVHAENLSSNHLKGRGESTWQQGKGSDGSPGQRHSTANSKPPSMVAPEIHEFPS